MLSELLKTFCSQNFCLIFTVWVPKDYENKSSYSYIENWKHSPSISNLVILQVFNLTEAINRWFPKIISKGMNLVFIKGLHLQMEQNFPHIQIISLPQRLLSCGLFKRKRKIRKEKQLGQAHISPYAENIVGNHLQCLPC